VLVLVDLQTGTGSFLTKSFSGLISRSIGPAIVVTYSRSRYEAEFIDSALA
jgi:hypothetical protein